MIDSLAICFDGQGLREFDSELKNGVRANSRIDDFELTSVSFNPVFLLSFFLSLFFFLHYTRYVASRGT